MDERAIKAPGQQGQASPQPAVFSGYNCAFTDAEMIVLPRHVKFLLWNVGGSMHRLHSALNPTSA